MKHRSIGHAALLGALLIASGACAQGEFPTKPVRLIVPYPPGGASDFVARELSAHMSRSLGQQLIIDNRPGAGTLVGLGLGARAAPDGYTVTLASSTALAILPALGTKMPIDPVKDFTPIGMMVTVPFFLVVNAALPVDNVKDLIALAKAQPGKLNFASPGVGTPNHLGGELLKMLASVNVVHVPYKGSGPATADLAGGQIQFMFAGVPPVAAMLQAKRVKIIAAATPTRSKLMPDAAPIAETLPGFRCDTWFALMAPSGTPPAIVSRLGAALMKALHAPEIVQRLGAQGVEATPMDADALRRQIYTDYKRWLEVTKRAGITADSAL